MFDLRPTDSREIGTHVWHIMNVCLLCINRMICTCVTPDTQLLTCRKELGLTRFHRARYTQVAQSTCIATIKSMPSVTFTSLHTESELFLIMTKPK